MRLPAAGSADFRQSFPDAAAHAVTARGPSSAAKEDRVSIDAE